MAASQQASAAGPREVTRSSRQRDGHDHQGLESTDSVRAYLREIGRIPLLTAADEVRLAREIEVGVLAGERLAEDASLTAADVADLELLVGQGRLAKATLVQSNLRLVVAIARRYTRSGASLLDLIQEGNIGLIRAVEKFDFQRGFKFSTYATWWIRQSIARGLADQGRTIRIPVHVVEALQRTLRHRRALLQQLGRSPTIDELAAKAQTTPERVGELLKLADEPMSLDVPIGAGEAGQLADIIVDDKIHLADEVGLLMLHSDVERLLELVTSREQMVLRLRFGLDGGRPQTLEEIGRVIGVTRERARQIQAKALSRIRRTHGLDGLRDYLHA
ncbi:MAG: sigma-70 family RNA polymerase sigma factor [Nocardioidaceae bacterium]